MEALILDLRGITTLTKSFTELDRVDFSTVHVYT